MRKFIQTTEFYIPTLNSMGYMTKILDPIQKTFILFAEQNKNDNFLDIGCAFGNVVIPLLSQGNFVTACDLDIRHLEAIKNSISTEQREKLTCCCGNFPIDLSFEKDYFKGILMAMVLHFMPLEYVATSFKSIAYSLTPGGKLFVTASSPYQGVLKAFIPIYHERKKRGVPFPGFVEDIGLYVPHRRKDLPGPNTLYTYDEIEVFCKNAGLFIEKSGFFTRPEIPKDIALAGEEYTYVIACKP